MDSHSGVYKRVDIEALGRSNNKLTRVDTDKNILFPPPDVCMG